MPIQRIFVYDSIRKIKMTTETRLVSPILSINSMTDHLCHTLYSLPFSNLLAMFVAVYHIIPYYLGGLCGCETNTIIQHVTVCLRCIFIYSNSNHWSHRLYGLLSIQGTSFNFLGPIIGAGLALKAGGADIQNNDGRYFRYHPCCFLC